MSDTRFIMIGLVLVFAGFLILGIFGRPFFEFTIQANEFGDCFDYEDGRAIPIDCDLMLGNKVILFGIVFALIAGGIIALIKGVRGKWDQDVKSDEMLGPKKGP
jgi:Na+-driven multidrug efflux pump